jgi:type I restriction enzyme M protein
VELPDTCQLPRARADLLGSFGTALVPLGLLDEFATAGIVASWWGDNLYDLKALAAGGFDRVVEGWATTIEAMLTPEPGPDGKMRPKSAADRRKALDHRLVPHLLPGFLADLENAEAKYAEEDAAYKRALAASSENNEGEEADEDAEPADLDELKAARSSAQKKRSALEKRFLATLNMAVASLTLDEARELVLKILDEDLAARLDARVAHACQAMIDRFRTWSDKYAVSLDDLESDRQFAAQSLAIHLQELGYE